ncbi:lipase family protein [Nocardia sp. NPDC052566]|uniref:lipase family protein n=1 Tax=Nocardia sp. NPDC052566 TaxID=3364330 RepID=UPI0037C8BD83
MRVVRGWKGALALATASACAAIAVQATPALADAPGTLTSITPQAAGWHGMADGSVVTYWMADADGTPRPASGALFVPTGTPPAGGWPIVAWDHGTTGLGKGCGSESDPTTAPDTHWHAEEDGVMQHLVARGFAVIAPDYLGLGLFDTGPHPYLQRQTEATATLDLLRAARAARPELSRTWAVMGPSQGGHAALSTGHLQASYAPELDFRGTIAIDPASDVEKALPAIGPSTPALPGADGSTGFFADIMAGLRAARPDIDVNQYLSPLGRAVLDDIGTMCSPQIDARVAGIGIGDLLSKPLSDNRIRDAYTDYLALPTSGYNRPILLLVNITDTMVPSPLHAALAAQLAANGVDFRTVTGTGSHTQLNPAMWSAIDTFLDHIQN